MSQLHTWLGLVAANLGGTVPTPSRRLNRGLGTHSPSSRHSRCAR